MCLCTGLSEADADLRDLVHMPPASVMAELGVSSSDEDSSDEAFAARHAVLEAEERAKFNSYAGEACRHVSAVVLSVLSLCAVYLRCLQQPILAGAPPDMCCTAIACTSGVIMCMFTCQMPSTS